MVFISKIRSKGELVVCSNTSNTAYIRLVELAVFWGTLVEAVTSNWRCLVPPTTGNASHYSIDMGSPMIGAG